MGLVEALLFKKKAVKKAVEWVQAFNARANFKMPLENNVVLDAWLSPLTLTA